MAPRVFALIVGINRYKAGSIWNLESCVDDARNMKSWLTNGLHVPANQIRMLLDEQATTAQVESLFMDHLVNNAAIERGDCVIIYFAGHGATIRAPQDWFSEEINGGSVQMLCTHDFATKKSSGRMTGISDRSMHAMIKELSAARGDNITLILDCCFSPPLRSRMNILDRKSIRWTPADKLSPDDLYADLWRGALGILYTTRRGFFSDHFDTHVLLAACSSGDTATEGKTGGLFTNGLLQVQMKMALHCTTYEQLVDSIGNSSLAGHRPLCLGYRCDRIVFNGVPFISDPRFVPTSVLLNGQIRVEAGAIHGILEGTEFNVHGHNMHGSYNPILASVRVSDLHSTWCIVRHIGDDCTVPKYSWAVVVRWNNTPPFYIYLSRWFPYLRRRRHFLNQVSSKPGSVSRTGLSIIRVKKVWQADLSVQITSHHLVLDRNDNMISSNTLRSIKVHQIEENKVIDDAARFHIHLHRRNVLSPFRGLVTMDMYRIDQQTWTRAEHNLIVDGKANLLHEHGAVYSIVIHNKSQYDLWPYLVFMDPNDYDVDILYHPEPFLRLPPLKANSSLDIGSGSSTSEAISFSLPDDRIADSAFLKLFVCSTYTQMEQLKQGRSDPILNSSFAQEKDGLRRVRPAPQEECWDATLTVVTITRPRNS